MGIMAVEGQRPTCEKVRVMAKKAGLSGNDPFADLSWGDLEQWVGSRSLERGRGYQKRRRVLALARTPEGRLSGRVGGTDLYLTHVSRRADDPSGLLSSECSCPIGGRCKHAVAVVLEYLECLKAGKEVPSELPRLPGDHSELETEEGDEEWDEDEPEAEEDPGELSDMPRRRAGKSRQAGPVDLEAYLEGLAASELIELVHELADASEDARRIVETRAQLASGEVGPVVAAARKELRRVASETGWQNDWSDEGYTPDYNMVGAYLVELLAVDAPDRVLDLGRELVQLGNRQVEQSHDEGEAGTAIAEALVPVWEALAQSSLTPAERILWVYDRYAEDEYDLCNGALEAGIWDVDAQVWGEVADALVAQLASQDVAGPRAKDGGSLRYRRGNLAGRVIGALQEAGRLDEAVALAVSEATVTDDYDRAVRLLLEAGRTDEAKALALEGIERTEASLPGISAQLRSRLKDLAARENDHALAAGFAAEEFARRSSLAGYRSLRELAERAGVWPPVRECVLDSLQTGSSAVEHPDWPLPPTGTAPEPKEREPQPSWDLLTEIALDEGDHARALECYRRFLAERPLWGARGLEEQVARDVVTTHPDESIAIWRGLAERAIAGGNRRAYEHSLQYLRPMQHALEQLGRGEEWAAYLSGLRAEHHRRRALLETLDWLNDSPILGK